MVLPTDDKKVITFSDYKYQERVPFVVYADIESILQPGVVSVHNHSPQSIAYYLQCSFNHNLNRFKLKTGKNCIEWFVDELKMIAIETQKYLSDNIKMEKLSQQQIFTFNTTSICHICNKTLGKLRHRDHCHLTGKYRGAAHPQCNLNYLNSFYIPVIFHNLSGYDAHFLIEPLVNRFKGSVHLLPINKEQYISFTKAVEGTKVSLRFIDSYKFMASSLQSLAQNLDDTKKIKIRSFCQSQSKCQLLCRKGVFPYEYISNWNKLEETSLPAKKHFFSTLNNENISTEEYEHAHNVWNTFGIRTLREYSELYLTTDTLLLADIFEAFRDNCMEFYKLDPAHFYTLPGYAWSAALRVTGVELELSTDPAKILFIEKGIRGGLVQCSHRYAKANNEYMGDDYNSNEADSYLMYFDVKHLYGAAMSSYLPYGDFHWVDTAINIHDIPDDSPEGYILEVDLEYPGSLHDFHRELPLCPQHFSHTNRKVDEKLMATLYPKEKYVVHYINSKLYLEQGMKLKKVHRILKFKQKPWLKPYIDMNTAKRSTAKNEFEKNFFKLMDNAVFGKTMENVRKHKDVKLVTKWEGRYAAKAFISKPNVHSSILFNENMAIIEMERLQVKFFKPIYVGFTILDLSKTWIYHFHYNYVKKEFGDLAKLLYTDTDSLIYQFFVPDVYENMKKDLDRFDTSDYPTDNIYNMPRVNKKVLGKMKDENNGIIMEEFIGLKAKSYATKIRQDNGKEVVKKRGKGIKNSIMKTVQMKHYKDCLLKNVVLYRTQYLINSKNHQVTTIEQRKKTLDANDDKREILPDLISTLPWGYTLGLDLV